MRIYISSTDKSDHKPLYEKVIYLAREQGIAGATVLKGIMGYGSSSEIYSNKLWEISEKIPLVVEIVDDPDRIDHFLGLLQPFFDKAGKGYLVTIDDTVILKHKTGLPR